MQFLLPKDDKFYNYFEQSTKNLLKAAELIKQLPNTTETQKQLVVRQIEDVEHRGDAITHEIFAELNKTFITPIDREDIHILASALDDILDNINGSAARFLLYKITDCPPIMSKLIDILYASINELHRGIGLVRELDKPDLLREVLKKVNEYENEADAMFEMAVADLFENEKDPIKIIKLKEIYVGLETATDKCEDAANVLEGLLIKHA
ncbi:MAG: DUF47 domain-containing protein [Ignavibacteriales bacterium]|nr:DUF47 domain-containing protein [Ignavibacteriales bacterium]